jgi:hypothetical protein
VQSFAGVPIRQLQRYVLGVTEAPLVLDGVDDKAQIDNTDKPPTANKTKNITNITFV